MQKRNYLTIVLTLLGSLKLILELLFDIKISDVEYNTIADFIGSVFTVVGIVMSHINKSAAVDQPSVDQPSQPTVEQPTVTQLGDQNGTNQAQ